MSLIHTMMQGDLLPVLEATLTDEDGAPVDLSDIGSLTFRLGRGSSGDDVLVERAAEVVGDGTEGNVRFVWEEGDTDVAGVHRGSFRLVSGGKPTTFPNDGYITVHIGDAVGP